MVIHYPYILKNILYTSTTHHCSSIYTAWKTKSNVEITYKNKLVIYIIIILLIIIIYIYI